MIQPDGRKHYGKQRYLKHNFTGASELIKERKEVIKDFIQRGIFSQRKKGRDLWK